MASNYITSGLAVYTILYTSIILYEYLYTNNKIRLLVLVSCIFISAERKILSLNVNIVLFHVTSFCFNTPNSLTSHYLLIKNRFYSQVLGVVSVIFLSTT